MLTHWENLDAMVRMGLPVNPRRVRCQSVDDIRTYYDQVLMMQGRFGYETDGIVVKVDSIQSQERLGVTVSRSPVGHRMEVPIRTGYHPSAGHHYQCWKVR